MNALKKMVSYIIRCISLFKKNYFFISKNFSAYLIWLNLNRIFIMNDINNINILIYKYLEIYWLEYK